MGSCDLSVPADRAQVQGPAKAGDPANRVVVFGTESNSGSADWRTLLFDCDQPADLEVAWAVGSARVTANITVARGSTMCVFAKSIEVVATGRSGVQGQVMVRSYTGRTDTANVFTVPLAGLAGGALQPHVVPPFAQRVRLDVGDSSTSAELTLVDAYNTARCTKAGGPGESVEADIGGCPNVFTQLPASKTGRLIFYLPF